MTHKHKKVRYTTHKPNRNDQYTVSITISSNIIVIFVIDKYRITFKECKSFLFFFAIFLFWCIWWKKKNYLNIKIIIMLQEQYNNTTTTIIMLFFLYLYRFSLFTNNHFSPRFNTNNSKHAYPLLFILAKNYHGNHSLF